MADGTTKPISEVEVGDVLWALDPETGVEGERTVTGVWPHYDWLLDFSVGDGFVQTTEDHHFWNESDREWQETVHIDTGDLLLTADGSFVAAGDLDWTSRTYGEAFDLTVEGLHTYFVDFGAGSVLVHNTDCSFDELGGLAAYVDRADLVDGVVEHAAARGRTILPSQVDDALSTTGTRIRDGIPGRDNAVRFELDDVVCENGCWATPTPAPHTSLGGRVCGANDQHRPRRRRDPRWLGVPSPRAHGSGSRPVAGHPTPHRWRGGSATATNAVGPIPILHKLDWSTSQQPRPDRPGRSGRSSRPLGHGRG